MATFAFRIAGGGGFTAPVGTVLEIGPHKRPGKAVVRLKWGRNHARTPEDGVNEFIAVGDWKKLNRRWRALLAARPNRGGKG